MGAVSIKMYDKFGIMLRIETTVNDVSQFKIFRDVEQRTGVRIKKNAPLKKNIYSLFPLASLLAACNRRYLEFISTLDDPSVRESKTSTMFQKPCWKTIDLIQDLTSTTMRIKNCWKCWRAESLILMACTTNLCAHSSPKKAAVQSQESLNG